MLKPQTLKNLQAVIRLQLFMPQEILLIRMVRVSSAALTVVRFEVSGARERAVSIVGVAMGSVREHASVHRKPTGRRT